jgi:hypothetical protein
MPINRDARIRRWAARIDENREHPPATIAVWRSARLVDSQSFVLIVANEAILDRPLPAGCSGRVPADADR